MGCEAGRCNKTFTPSGIFIVIPSIEGWPTKVKEAPSSQEVRLTLLDTNPVFLCLIIKKIRKWSEISLFTILIEPAVFKKSLVECGQFELH